MGEDGHTASLFPEMPSIDDPRRVTIPVGLNYLKEDRVSLSLSVINSASHVVLLATGRKKADMVKAILEEGASVPAARVCASEGETLFILDAEAASKLQDPYQYIYRDEPTIS
jgi:6-phosphogluconolactonase